MDVVDLRFVCCEIFVDVIFTLDSDLCDFVAVTLPQTGIFEICAVISLQ